MAKSVREISAKAFVKDLRSGMEEADILTKYSLSRERLHSVLNKLVAANAIGQTEMDVWLSAPQSTGLSGNAAESTEAPLIQNGGLRRLRIPKKPPETAPPPHSKEEPAQDHVGSGNVAYRLKLYGRLANDSDAFSADLAAVLGIDAQQARDYLDRVPVTVKEGLSEEKADRLRSILLSVGALCLVEPMDGAEQQPASAPSREASIADALLMRGDRKENSAGIFPTRVKPSLLALLGTVLVLCVAGIYLVFTTRTAREEFTFNPPVEKGTAEKPGTAQVIPDEEALPAIKNQIIYLEGEVPKLMSRLTQEKTAFDLLVNTPGVEYDELQKKTFEMEEIQEQIGDIQWQLRTLRKKAALMERHVTSAEKPELAPQPTE